jgi:hypothetical protein
MPLLVYGVYPAAGSSWRYKTDFTDTTLAQFIATHGNSWRDESFDDSSWAQGASQIGYGDSPRDEVTLVARTDYSTAAGTQSGPVGLFRAQFTITDLGSVGGVSGRVLFDDSCAVFVNGTQVYRHADLTANAPLTEYTETTTTSTRENVEANFTVPLGLLHSGANIIAVEFVAGRKPLRSVMAIPAPPPAGRLISRPRRQSSPTISSATPSQRSCPKLESIRLPPSNFVDLYRYKVSRGDEIPFGISAADQRHHLDLIGKTGSGKTTLLRNLVVQHIAAGHGVGLINPHGDLAEELLDCIPPRRADDLV